MINYHTNHTKPSMDDVAKVGRVCRAMLKLADEYGEGVAADTLRSAVRNLPETSLVRLHHILAEA
jgi:hypothetical protein